MLLVHYWKAFQGFLIWNRIDRKYHAPIYILMPKEKDVYNYYALLHLEQFLKGKGLREAVLLTCDREAIAALDLFFPTDKGISKRMSGQPSAIRKPPAKRPILERLVKAVYIRRNDAVKLLKYYALNEFTSRLAIVSFTEPYDTHAQNLLGLHRVDKEGLVCFDIYRLSEKTEINPPQYIGEDERITAFLNRVNRDSKVKFKK